MKVCIVGSSKQFFSGLTTHTIFLANAMAERGHEVSVILMRNLVPHFLYPGKERIGKGEYIVDFLPEIRVYNGMDWDSPVSWLRALKFLRSEKPEIVIILWWTSSIIHMQLLLALAARFGGRSLLLLEMHEVLDVFENKFFLLRFYSRTCGRLLMNQFHSFTVPSEDVRKAVVQAYGLANQSIDIVPIGLYSEYKKADRIASRKKLGLDGFVILFFGMMKQFKGIPLLVKAFNMLPETIANNSQLIIIGENWGDDLELEPAINNSPYCDRIIFRPEFVPDMMVPKFFAAADVVVLPYLRTCGSGVASIALAYGKPIITTDLSTMRENLADFKGAYFFPPGDMGALKDLIVETYCNWQSGGIENYGCCGVTWEDVAKRYELIIERLVENKLCTSHK